MILPCGKVFDGFRRRHDEPSQVDDDLYQDQGAADDQLGLGTDELKLLPRFLSSSENPSDPVGFSEKSGVDDREADANQEPLEAADNVGGPEDEEEGDGIAEEEADEEYIAELSSRSSDHRGVVVFDIDDHDGHGEEDSKDREGEGKYGCGVVGREVHKGDLNAAAVDGIGEETHRTVGANCIIEWIHELKWKRIG